METSPASPSPTAELPEPVVSLLASLPKRQRPKVAPHFVVAVVNDTTILRCVLSIGAATVESEVMRLPARDTDAAMALPPTFLRVLLYSPNLVADEYPSFAWDAQLVVDGTLFDLGTIKRRCDVIEKRFMGIPTEPRNVQLRLDRVRLHSVRSEASEELARLTLEVLQDPTFNPRGGSVTLQQCSEEVSKRHTKEFNMVIGSDHLGSFRAFILAHDKRFSVFHYQKSEIEARGMHNVKPYDERIAIRKGLRDSLPPMVSNVDGEQQVLMLLIDALKDCDSHVHVLMRQLSTHEVFRVYMAAGFSTLMHWLQKHKDHFCWSTDPQTVCVIGLVRDRKLVESMSSHEATEGGEDLPGEAAHTPQQMGSAALRDYDDTAAEDNEDENAEY